MQSYKKTFEIVTIATAVFLCGCEKSLFQHTPRYMREPGISSSSGNGTSKKADTPGGKEDKPVGKVYITTVDGDNAMLFEDGKEIARARVSGDWERHRDRQGHLWTDAVEGKETVIFRDGEEWLRFPGEELLQGFLIRDDALHTLGQNPGSGGITYRIDGQEVFSSPIGRIVGASGSREWDAGAFSADSSGVYYCYTVPIGSTGSTSWEYHVMKGPDPFLVIPDYASGVILDVRVFKGRVYQAVLQGKSLRLISGGIVLWSHKTGLSESLSDVALVPYNGEMCIKAVSHFSNLNHMEAWLRNGKYNEVFHEVLQGYTPNIIRTQKLKANWSEYNGHIYRLELNGQPSSIDFGNYILTSPLCINTFKDSFLAILADTTSVSPRLLLITDTLTTPLHLPGIPTSIRIE